LQGGYDVAKLIIGLIVGALVTYLVLNPSEEVQKSAKLSESPEYVANKAVVEAMFQAHMDEDMEAWSALVADSLKWSSPSYGSVSQAGTKDDWTAVVKNYQEEFDDLAHQQSVYLPGLDGVTAEPDGSVRVYVHWKGTHTATGVVAEPWYYANYDLEGGKIVAAMEFMDVGGMMNHIAAGSAGE